MKVIVQIPCLNEEATLPQTVRAIPRRIEGVDAVEVLVVDDGSTDRTAEVAREVGVDYVVRHTHNQGLARAFQTGMDACLRLGADIIVNTDADNQYSGEDIHLLVEPILRGTADITIGDRQTHQVQHFSWTKRRLQRVGSRLVSALSGLQLNDAVSGFRAMSRAAAMEINIVSSFSYTIEMLIQAGRKQMKVVSVPVTTNPVTRESRLFSSISQFVQRSAATMVRVYTMYKPLRVFFFLGLVLVLAGLAPILRFLYFYLQGQGSGHVQSLILGGSLLVIGYVTLLIGLVADLISFNRRLIEMLLKKIRHLETMETIETDDTTS